MVNTESSWNAGWRRISPWTGIWINNGKIIFLHSTMYFGYRMLSIRKLRIKKLVMIECSLSREWIVLPIPYILKSTKLNAMRQLLKRSCVYSRLFVCLALSVTCLYSIAQATNQHDNTVTLSGSNIPLSEIFRAIKLQTGFSVMYSKAVTGLDQGDQVTVRFSKTPLDQVLAI